MTEQDRLLGEHNARLDGIEKRLDSMQGTLENINGFVQRVSAGWKIVLAFAAFVGAGFKWALDHLVSRANS